MMKTDIAVIGGGAIGVAVAYFLKQMDAGVAVTVVERDPTYALASTPRALGGIRRLFSLPENIALSNFSIPFFDDFAETMVVDGVKAEIGLRKQGYLFIVPPSGRAVLARNFETQQRMGCNVIWLEPDAIKQRFPSMQVADLGAAVYSPDDGWLDPHSVLMGFATRRNRWAQCFWPMKSPGWNQTAHLVRSLYENRCSINRSNRDCGNSCFITGTQRA